MTSTLLLSKRYHLLSLIRYVQLLKDCDFKKYYQRSLDNNVFHMGMGHIIDHMPFLWFLSVLCQCLNQCLPDLEKYFVWQGQHVVINGVYFHHSSSLTTAGYQDSRLSMWFSSSKHNFQFQTLFCIFSCRRIVSLLKTLGHSCNQTLFLCVCVMGLFTITLLKNILNKLVKRLPEPSVKTSNRPAWPGWDTSSLSYVGLCGWFVVLIKCALRTFRRKIGKDVFVELDVGSDNNSNESQIRGVLFSVVREGTIASYDTSVVGFQFRRLGEGLFNTFLIMIRLWFLSKWCNKSWQLKVGYYLVGFDHFDMIHLK